MKIAMIGNPNVGKSSILNRLTGSRVFISNYPGTSVEVNQGSLQLGNRNYLIYDTPGIYSVYSDGQEPEVVRSVLDQGGVQMVINVVDATNLERNLALTYELMETGVPVLIVLNQIDRARSMGIVIDEHRLERILNKPVIKFSATTGEGLLEVLGFLEKKDFSGIQAISLNDMGCAVSCSKCGKSCSVNDKDFRRVQRARDTARQVSTKVGESRQLWLDRVENFIDRPVTGTIFLLVIAYLGFKALIEFIELSEGPITSWLAPVSDILENLIIQLLPHGIITKVLSHAVPEGLIIPFTIVMPAMLMVSILMSLLEDTGLLPRYSVALERVGRLFGVSGQAVIPLALGFGCRTPAVVATRILPGAGQRFIIITLLSIVIPCAATLGILASVISAFNASLSAIVAAMLMAFITLSFILSRTNPEKEEFIYELPPLRIPMGANIWSKIKTRFAGFFTEVLPLLLVMSIIIRAIIESGILDSFKGMDPVTHSLFGIPAEAFIAVLLTIFQRYLAPLVLLNLALTPREATIAIAMVAISLPCLPVMVMTVKEMGWKVLGKIIVLGLTTSFVTGVLLNLILLL
ncbi:FeoB small GTPase domain-containing protein [Syntrophomonas erecta subsp. sporosyntropha]